MNISIIDDEKVLTNNISKKLQKNGYSVSAFYSYKDFMHNGDEFSHLYIVDLSLGDGSGFDIISWLRKEKWSSAPIIITSGYGDTENKIYGLDLWADDYLAKPFIPEELLARIRALLRRPLTFISDNIVSYKDISVNRETKLVMLRKKEIHLTRKETLLVELFIVNQGKLLDKDKIIKTIWWGNSAIDVKDNTINVTISKVRKKLGGKFKLKTIINKGYILEK